MKLGGTKEELADKLRKLGVLRISVQRDGKEVKLASNTLGSFVAVLLLPKSPSFWTVFVWSFPSIPNFRLPRSSACSINVDGSSFTHTPYTPEVQPIEKVWALAKNIVARAFSFRRTPDQLHTDLIMAFYAGDIRTSGSATKEFCQRVIDHSRKWCDTFTSEHVHPGGNLDSLATWLDDHPEEEAVSDPNRTLWTESVKKPRNYSSKLPSISKWMSRSIYPLIIVNPFVELKSLLAFNTSSFFRLFIASQSILSLISDMRVH